MLRFTLAGSGGVVSISPDAVSSVEETTAVVGNKSLLSGNFQSKQTAVIRMSDGISSYTVEDPNRTVARQIEESKKNG